MGPFLFNVFINDMLNLVGEADICNYADDTNIYACDVTVDLVIDKLEKHSFEMASWFSKNFMKLNSGGSSVKHWGGPFSLQRAWLAEFAPKGVTGRKLSPISIYY